MVSLSMTLNDLYPQFQNLECFESRLSWKSVLKTKLLFHNRKLFLIYGMLLFCDLDWPLNASRRFVSISWASCHKRLVRFFNVICRFCNINQLQCCIVHGVLHHKLTTRRIVTMQCVLPVKYHVGDYRIPILHINVIENPHVSLMTTM